MPDDQNDTEDHRECQSVDHGLSRENFERTLAAFLATEYLQHPTATPSGFVADCLFRFWY